MEKCETHGTCSGNERTEEKSLGPMVHSVKGVLDLSHEEGRFAVLETDMDLLKMGLADV
jgi:hypothetical protein